MNLAAFYLEQIIIMDNGECYLGIDIGGTNLRAGLCSQNDVLTYEFSEKTPKDLKNFFTKIKEIVSEAESFSRHKNLKIKAAGLGIPGLVDYQKQKIIYCPNLKFLNNLGVEEFSPEIPIFLGNDVDLALLGEEWQGRIKENSFAYLALGTGLGGAFKINDV